tara:strand:+ start:117 stop:1175 length:1059 start_codon:yes stop_codon:yes gene_type:complete
MRSSDTYPLVSIIIPHWNNFPILEECLLSIKKCSYPNYEIIVVDNASEDNSSQKIKEQFPEIILIENQINNGYAEGCNIGVSKASGKYLLFLNNDTTHEEGWIEPLVNHLDENKSAAAVQPKILNYYQKNLFDYAGGSGGHMDILCFPFARGRLFLEQELDKGQYDNPEKIFWTSGTAMIVRKNLFIKAGKFDKTFFAHMEEIDLCWRLQMLGYNVWVEPISVVYHKNAVSLPMYTLKKYYLNHRNSLYMLCGNFSFPLAIYLLPIRIILENIAFIYSLSKFDWRHMAAIFMALFWLLFHPHLIIKKRRKSKSLKAGKESEIIKKLFKGSVVLEHYILGKKTYREIFTKAES